MGGSILLFSLLGGRFAPLYTRQSHHCCKPVLCPFTIQVSNNRCTII